MAKIAASIRDVARDTGLSTATISRVVNGDTKVSEKTRQLVLDACSRLDYLPNPAARALSTRRSRVVAAIIPTIEHSVFAKFISAIERTLGLHGYSLVLAISNADEAEELAAARKLLGMGADAFILSGQTHSKALLGMLAKRQVPYVYTSVWDPLCEQPTVGYDNADLAGQALRHLYANGHRRVAVVHGPLAESDRTVARRDGARALRGLFDTLDFFETPLSVAGGKACVGHRLADGGGYSAYLCFSDVLALGAYFACADVGKQIPQDVSVMGFDNLDWAEAVVPPLTTIDLPASGMGEAVGTHIVECLETSAPMQSQQLTARIIERGSVAQLT
ncbi:LacI family DNA-binding transcriptional regulator [uncultured Tateyamaria sp.]|uniref:LacI family DNA-binding transcriptional regulator n=1 Tax=uncultured Tateyamaria sp. TaxID=455651 RepID=UPI00261A55E4|nr:LacI family DNA-binding transcriptional regulator [uncultured Tateyamaria sp.]